MIYDVNFIISFDLSPMYKSLIAKRSASLYSLRIPFLSKFSYDTIPGTPDTGTVVLLPAGLSALMK